MIPGGYILQPRLFYKSDAAHFPPCTRELWHYLLAHVNHADNGRYKRGQGFFQFTDIQEALSWTVGYRKEVYSKPQLTKALRRLNEGTHGEPMTATTKATRGIVVTVLNYDLYQNPGNYEGNGEGSTKETRRDLEGRTKNKNVKKKEEKKEQTSFDLFYEAYPKKVAKGAAVKAWKKVKVDVQTILNALEWQCVCEQWTKDGKQFIPNPATYLNNLGWEDEPPQQQQFRQQFVGVPPMDNDIEPDF